MEMSRERKQFTLIELLVVIAIIAILAGLLLPTLFGVRQKAKEAKAKVEIKSLQTAIAQYESTYGYLPKPAGSGTSDTCLDATQYGILINLLQNGTPGNVRGIRFLDVVTEQGIGHYDDPWEHPYSVVLDFDYDGKLDADATDGPIETVYASVAIWSWGKNETNNKGDVDDLTSWKK
jgi:prepilin-type N-terminal cleavage/methylation domain-containing protein